MALETGNYVGDLVITNPTSSDQKSAGDDHLRLIKTALKTSFAGFTGSIILTGSDTGGVNNYALTPTPALPAYVAGMMVLFNPSATNTTTSTINISALGAKTIKTVDGAALTAGDFVTGIYHLLIYDGTDFRLIGLTKNYADNLSFSSSLPSQTGNGGKYITTDGATASWADPYASAPLTGVPTAPTAAVDTNTTQIATTGFVIGQAYAKLASPALTGTPTAPTGTADITTSQIINAAWYNGQKGTSAPIVNGSATAGTSKKWSPINHVHPTDTSRAATAGPTFTGTVTLPTPTADITTTQAINAAWYNGQKGTAAPIINGSATAGTSKKWSPIDHVHPTDTSRAPTASPTFTGVVTAPSVKALNTAKFYASANVAGSVGNNYNVSSVTDVGTGDAQFNFTSAVTADIIACSDVYLASGLISSKIVGHSSVSVRVQSRDRTDILTDPSIFYVIGFSI